MFEKENCSKEMNLSLDAFSNELKKQIAEEYLYGEEMLSIHKLGQKHNIERNVSRLYIKKWCDEFFGKEEYEKRAAKTRRTPRGG